jgi:hypothetical protein
MAKNNPVKICTPRHNPNREPKFHMAERLAGDGNSTNEPETIFNTGCVLLIEYI